MPGGGGRGPQGRRDACRRRVERAVWPLHLSLPAGALPSPQRLPTRAHEHPNSIQKLTVTYRGTGEVGRESGGALPQQAKATGDIKRAAQQPQRNPAELTTPGPLSSSRALKSGLVSRNGRGKGACGRGGAKCGRKGPGGPNWDGGTTTSGAYPWPSSA